MLEHHIYPIVGRRVRLGRKDAGGSIPIDPVPAGDTVGKGLEWWAVHTSRREVVQVGAVVAIEGMVGRHVDRVGSDEYRAREKHLPLA